MAYWCLEYLLDHGFKFEFVATHPVKQEPFSGYTPPNLTALANQYGIELYHIDHSGKVAMKDLVKEHCIDLIVSVNWRLLFPEDVLTSLRFGAINLHGSLLPKHRGNAPITWAVLEGDSETGATLHWIDSGMDTGGIISQHTLPIGRLDNYWTILEAFKKPNCHMLEAAIPCILDGTVESLPQEAALATVGKRRTPDDGMVNWEKTCIEVHNWIRGQSWPLPGAFSIKEGRRVVFGESAPHAGIQSQLPPGTIDSIDIFTGSAVSVLVACGSGVIELKSVAIDEGMPDIISAAFATSLFQPGSSFNPSG